MLNADILHRDFRPEPYWWEAYRPAADQLVEVPKAARVAIVGAGYAGLSTALELAKQGIDAVVLEAGELGFGASTRNGGAVSGGVNVGKSFTGKTIAIDERRAAALLSDAGDAFALIDRLIDEERIDCFWEKRGRFVGAWTRAHFASQQRRLELLNAAAQSGAYMVAARASARRNRQRLLSRRHGGRALGETAPGTLLQGAARRLPSPRDRDLRQGGGWPDHARRDRLAGRDPARHAKRRRCRDRHQRLYRRFDAGVEAAGGADREPHHRHRGIAGRSRRIADPEWPHPLRYAARLVLLPDVA